MVTLSFCIIARNEEKNLLRCLKSIENIADEIIIVDTGSIDITKEIAKSFNSKIIDFPWNNNFSLAKNMALKQATKDWIFFIDCDESLDSSQSLEIKNYLDKTPYLGFNLKLINIINNKALKGDYIFRIFKNNEGFYYDGYINETLKNPSLGLNLKDKIKNLDLNLYNHGFDMDKTSLIKRSNRNLFIYSDFEHDKKDYLYYFNLGNEYYLLENYPKAINNYTKSLYSSKNIYISSYITFIIIKSYYQAEKYNLGISFGECLSANYNKFRENNLMIALCYKNLGSIEEYKDYYKTYLNSENTFYDYFLDLEFIKNKHLIPEMFGFRLENLIR
ncbi:glycosyltransferase [Clostridium sp.]|uniref:glycosyltransferase n=1 Tax=Clostridium sp. TaxID=1506 RepID=UPI002612E85A|nr:glycosyltransferase [Clostridium sp.]